MNLNRYSMSGKDGNLRLTINGFVVAYAESFNAVLFEHMKEYTLRSATYSVPNNYEVKLQLNRLSMPHPDIIAEIINDLSHGQLSDFVFNGWYRTGQTLSPVVFRHCIPESDDLGAFLDGFVDQWVFKIYQINEELIKEFKNAQ